MTDPRLHRPKKGVKPVVGLIVFLLSIVILSATCVAYAQTFQGDADKPYVSSNPSNGAFTLVASNVAAALVVSSSDFPGVVRVLKHLQSDIGRVSGVEPNVLFDTLPKAKEIVLVGTLGRSLLIDKLVREKKLVTSGIQGKWETFLLQVVDHPLAGVDKALVIVGSDKRGTIYGIYDLASQIGVSPWYWWADVPVKKQPSLYVLPGAHSRGEPAVKYRGIFINDEAPALSGWVNEKFDGFNSRFYEKVFELILRLKGNYLWPAMWGRAFYDDDSLNPKLADEYGVVIATSHHEPMMRAHDEWKRYGKGPWNYEKNDTVLRSFWKQGIKRMNSYESVVTVGMRGDGDEPMSEKANIALLERIIQDQRQILGEVTGKDVSTIPQVWALYKEVQEYYDKGMRVPDDVTLLLCDDNWGNIRKLPKLEDKHRAGGYGIYYHFDYVGGPRNYKWVNTSQIARIWEQMHLAFSYGVNRIWVVNVGDIKPMEFPTQFFLDYAWNPAAWPAERLPEYTRRWAEQQFGREHARAMAGMLTDYTRFNARRKPELLAPGTYSLVNYREADKVVAEYNTLAISARRIYRLLPGERKDAFYQLVMHPIEACSNLNDLYVTVGKNRLYASQGRASAAALGERAIDLFYKDSAISDYYNRAMANGKWNHMMDQTHIGYTYWQQPEYNAMPEVKRPKVPDAGSIGVAVEGSEKSLPAEGTQAALPEFDRYNQQRYYVDLFNRGVRSIDYSIQSGKPWIQISSTKGKILVEDRLWVTVDWKKVPIGKHQVPITIASAGKKIVLFAAVHNPRSPNPDRFAGFIESDGYVSMEAEHYTRAVGSSTIGWQRIPDLGRTLSAMTPMPVTAASQAPGGDNPRLEYTLYLFGKGEVKVDAFLSPTLNFHGTQGLRYAVSFDDQPPQMINMHAQSSNQMWEQWVSNNINISVSRHIIDRDGAHILKFWMVDPGVVLQKLVVETRTVKPSYLGPPESYRGSKDSRRTR